MLLASFCHFFKKNGNYLPLDPKEVVSLSDLSSIKLRNSHSL
jgi:hypothetical protein